MNQRTLKKKITLTLPKDYLIAQLYLTLCNPIDCSLVGSSVDGIFQEEYTVAIKRNTFESVLMK